jgi:hypothetical protein
METMLDESYAGRGKVATADMKARIASLRANGFTGEQIISILYDRLRVAEQGDGFIYDHAEPEPVRPDGQLRQPTGR